MKNKQFLNFEFTKVGTFYLGESAYKSKNHNWKSPTQIKFINDDIVNAECSTYLVCLGDHCKQEHILYVGEYTNSLKQRWLRKHNSLPANKKQWVSWHSDNLDNNLNRLLKIVNEQLSIKDVDWEAKTARKKEAIHENISKILSEVKIGSSRPELSLWLTYDPWVKLPNGHQVNISRSIEQEFLASDLPLPLNTKGRNKPLSSTISVKIWAN
ncbi:hypothetical protein [Thalassotalea montiporae]